MDDDEALDRLLREFGLPASDGERGAPDNAAPPRWDELDDEDWR